MPTFDCSAMTLPAQLHADDRERLEMTGVQVETSSDELLLTASKRLGNRNGTTRALTYRTSIDLDSLEAATSMQVNQGEEIPGARGALSVPARNALGFGLRQCAANLGSPVGDALRTAANRLSRD